MAAQGTVSSSLWTLETQGVNWRKKKEQKETTIFQN